MGLTTKKEEDLKRMPKVEFQARKSKDGRYLIHRTVITDIKPIAYYDKVMASTGTENVDEASAE